MVTRHEPTCISVARCARMIFCSLKLSLSTPLAFLAPICCVPKKMSCLAPLYPPATSARSTHTHSLLCRSMACPEPPDPGVCHLVRPARPAAQHYGQKEQTAQAGERWEDMAAGDGSAEKHFSAYCYYCRTLHPSRARGRRAREGARRVATPSLSWSASC